MSKVTVSRAAELTGKSRETINKATQNGMLSFTRNASGHKEIAIAELERVYPLVMTIEELNQRPKTVSSGQPSSEPDAGAELASLREKLAGSKRDYEALAAERERERRQLQSEIENLRASLERAQEQHKALLLITDQTKKSEGRAGDWEESLRAFDSRLAAHEERAEQERRRLRAAAKKKIAGLKRELEEERKSILQKLFG